MHIPSHKLLISALVLYIPVAEATGGNFKLTPILGASIFGIAAIGAFVFYFFSKKNQPLIKVESEEPSHISTNASREVPESITPQPQPQPQQQQQQQKQFEEEEQIRLRNAEEKRLKEKKALEERRRQEEEEEREEKRLQEEKARQLLVDRIRRHKEEKEQKRLEELKRKEELAREEEERKKELELEKERELERQNQNQNQNQEQTQEIEKEVEIVSEPIETPSKYDSPNRLKKKAGSHINFTTSGTTSSPLGRRSPSFSDIPRPDLDKLAQEDYSDNYEPEQRDRERSFSESASAPPKISFDNNAPPATHPKNAFFPTTPSQCSVCRGSIFGKPVETSSGTKFHPRCFTCAKCQKKITGKYFPYEHPPTAPVPQVEWFLCEYCSNSLKQSRPAFKKT